MTIEYNDLLMSDSLRDRIDENSLRKNPELTQPVAASFTMCLRILNDVFVDIKILKLDVLKNKLLIECNSNQYKHLTASVNEHKTHEIIVFGKKSRNFSLLDINSYTYSDNNNDCLEIQIDINEDLQSILG